MLRVALVTQAYHPAVGGVTEHVDATARELRARGHEVTVVTSRHRGSSQEPGVVRVGRNVSVAYNGAENNVTVGLSLARGLGAILAKGRFDVVHVHCPLSPILPLLALQLSPCPVVGTFHSALVSDAHLRLFRPVLVPFYRRMDRVIAVSETARACVAALFSGPIEIVPNGVDRARFFPGVARLERFDDGTPNLLFVGRFDSRKGLPELMQACAALAGEGHPFRVILVGDGQLRPTIERMADGPLRGRVHFEGRVGHAHLPRYYASADVFCSPARDGESFGMVLLEAMASGVPIVATDIEGYRCVFTPGEEGLAIPPRDPRSLADALRRMLLDPGLRARCGARGAETARSYGWNRIVDRHEAIYRSLAGVPAREPAAPPRAAAEIATLSAAP